MSKTIDIKVPDIGNYSGIPIIEVLVKDGDAVDKEQPLLVLESDKATMEVPAPQAGIVRGLKLKVGDKVSQNDLIGQLETETASAAAPAAPSTAAKPDAKSQLAPAPAPAPVVAPLPPEESAPKGAGEGAPPPATAPIAAQPLSGPGPQPQAFARPELPPAVPQSPGSPPALSRGERENGEEGVVPYAGPATRKFARELGVDLAQIKGSAARGRIVVEDVQAFVKQRLTQPPAATLGGGAGIPAIPAVDFAQFGEIETKPLARIRKLSAAHLHRAWLNIPHVTQTDEADITELESFRKAQSEEGGVKLTLLPFVIKAVAVALKQYPEFNASLAPDGENLILKRYIHIGFAADTPNGLVVPVVRDADRKGLVQLAQETAELAKKARDGKLKPDEMKGGCFSISSLGGIGGSHFTPIVNAPEVGILGVSRSQMKPVWDGQAFQPRLMCPLSLSYDHRVIDGAYAARFIVLLVKLLSDLRRLSL